MNDFTVSMAIVDYVPVILFMTASVILLRDLYDKMEKGAFALFSAGLIDVVVAGALKATWKLLYALEVCDFTALDEMFFPVQSIGFLLAGVGILAMLFRRRANMALAVAAPPVFSGTFVFVGLMVAGLGIMDVVLCILAVRLRRPWLIAVFLLSFVCSLCMGYLSSKDFAEASMNWIAEGVNVAGQGAFLVGALLLHKNGLARLKLHGGEKV